MRFALHSLTLTFVLLAGASAAHADSYAYMGNGSSDFGVIDLTTGFYTSCGTTAGVTLAGLGVSNNTLYGATFRGSSFYRVAPATGALTTVATSNIQFFDLGSTLKSLYAVDVNGDLYSINNQTGTATLVGPTGISVTGNGYWGMSTNSATLYFSHQAALYKLNLTTGHGVKIGTGTTGEYGAFVTENGTLFAGSESPFAVYSVAPSTGSNAQLADVAGSGASSFWGLAPIKATKLGKRCAVHRF